MAVGTLSTRITNQLQSLQGLHLRLREIGAYLQKVLDGELPVNHAILGNLQDVFNLLPNLAAPAEGAVKGVAGGAQGGVSELSHAMGIKTNDQMMAIYLSSLIRAITAFHDLIENKVQNKQHDEEKEREKEDAGRKEVEKKQEREKGDKEKDGKKEGEKEEKSRK